MVIQKLAEAEIRARAAGIKAVLTDVDGVLTDTAVWVGPDGELAKRFSVRDGMGFELLRNEGLKLGIVTRETSPIVTHRAEKLRVDLVLQGVRDKLPAVVQLCAEQGWEKREVVYMGDDVNDLEVLNWLAGEGLTAAPADATDAILGAAQLITAKQGGQGAFRELADALISWRQS